MLALQSTSAPGAQLVIDEGAPHGIPATRKDRLNADLLAFLKASLEAQAARYLFV